MRCKSQLGLSAGSWGTGASARGRCSGASSPISIGNSGVPLARVSNPTMALFSISVFLFFSKWETSSSCSIGAADATASFFSKLACLIFLSIKSLSATLILGIFGSGVEQNDGGETGEPHDEAMAFFRSLRRLE